MTQSITSKELSTVDIDMSIISQGSKKRPRMNIRNNNFAEGNSVKSVLYSAPRGGSIIRNPFVNTVYRSVFAQNKYHDRGTYMRW